jgi:hypothetical protein
MTTILLYPPANSSKELSHGGTVYKISKAGAFEVPASAAEHLTAHGFSTSKPSKTTSVKVEEAEEQLEDVSEENPETPEPATTLPWSK